MSQNTSNRPSATDRLLTEIEQELSSQDLNVSNEHENNSNHNRRAPSPPDSLAPPPLQRMRVQDNDSNEPRALPIPPRPPLITDLDFDDMKAGPPILDKDRDSQPTPPPQSQRRNRTYNDYTNYLKIIAKIQTRIGPHTASNFEWVPDSKQSETGGVICKPCSHRPGTAAYWSKLKPVTNYNVYKMISHVKTPRHQKCVGAAEHDELNKLQSETCALVIIQHQSAFKQLYNKFALLLQFAKCNYHISGFESVATFIHSICGNMNPALYANHDGNKSILLSMSNNQKQKEYDTARSMCDHMGISLALDGQRKHGLSEKVFSVRGISVGGIRAIEIYLDLLPMNKNMHDYGNREYNLSSFLSINTAPDQLLLVDEIMKRIDRPHSKLHVISSDGDTAVLGRHNGLVKLLQRSRNGRVEPWSVLCHRMNVVIAYPFNKMDKLAQHIRMLKSIANLMNDSVPQQVLLYIEEMDSLKLEKIRKCYDKRWIFMTCPMQSITKNYNSILKTLQYIQNERPCAEDRDRVKVAKLYWGDVANLILNQTLTAICLEGDKLIKRLSRRNLDRLSGMVYIYEYIETIQAYHDHGISKTNGYILEQKGKLKFKQEHTSNGDRYVLRIGDWKWELLEGEVNLDGVYDKWAVRVCAEILKAYKKKFDHFEREIMKELLSAIDPIKFRKFPSVRAIKDYGNNQVRNVIRYMHTNMMNARNEKMYTYPTELVLAQYEMSKPKLFELSHYDIPENRFPEYLEYLVSKIAMFGYLVQFLRNYIIGHCCSVSLERFFSVRTWIEGRNRMNMSHELLECLLRLILNGPRYDTEDAKVFIIESMLSWYTEKDRQLKSDVLEKLKVAIEATTKKEAIEELIENMWD